MKVKPNRIIVIGATGSGKTTLAKVLAKYYNLPHIELDRLFFSRTSKSGKNENFWSIVKEEAAKPEWICDGIFYKQADVIWPKADLVIWVDTPLGVTFWRVLRRSMKRIIMRQNMPGGRRETLKTAFGSDGIVKLTPHIYRKVKDKYPLLIKALELETKLVHLSSTKEMKDWLKNNNIE